MLHALPKHIPYPCDTGSGYARMYGNFCRLTNCGFSGTTLSTGGNSIAAPSADAIAVLVGIYSVARAKNAVGVRFATVAPYGSYPGGTDQQGAYGSLVYEQVATAAGTSLMESAHHAIVYLTTKGGNFNLNVVDDGGTSVATYQIHGYWV